jgi:hypothetical protein
MTEARKPIFEPNQFYESILDLRAKDAKTFASLSPATKAALFAYEQAKRQAAVDAEAAA